MGRDDGASLHGQVDAMKFIRLFLAAAWICAPAAAAYGQSVNPGPSTPAPQYAKVFLASGSGTLPTACVAFHILGVGAGASGAGGTTVAVSGSGGGSGGTGAQVDTGWLPVSLLSTLNYSVVVGAGGATAAAGAAGNTGGNTTVTFGGAVFTFGGANSTAPTAGASAAASTGGAGGAPANYIVSPSGAGAAGVATVFYNAGVVSGNGSSALGGPAVAAAVRMLPTAGGAGGGLNAGAFQVGGGTNLSGYSGVGGTVGGAAAGANGGNGQSNASWPLGLPGNGGGGGAGNGTGVGGNGGSGGQPGAGGGGGGSGTGGGGTGGAGGNGAAYVECHN